uniref:Leucine rich repeat containing 34 n=1 Tax=Pseudonaja textilis TaxID=8673 RepID=A0A670ZBW2_PSETE
MDAFQIVNNFFLSMKEDSLLANKVTVKIAGNNRLIPVQKVTDSDFQILASVFMNNVFLTDNINYTPHFFLLNKTLCYLRMTGNKIENKGGMYFAAMIQVNTTIQKLDFGDCDLVSKLKTKLFERLVKNKNLVQPSLQYTEETTIHIASMLKVNCTLVELHLCKHGMKNFGIERLCDALYNNSTLRYLDLSCNKISRDGMKFLGQLLKQNTTLEIVDLNFNRIEDDGAFYLSDALATHNQTLQALAVTYNNLSGAGLVALSDAMKTNPVLSYIYIWGNKFDEAACVAFAELLQSGRLKPTGTDVEPYEVDGRIYLAEVSHGLKRHYYWTPSYGEPDNEYENASLAINPVIGHL